MMPLLIAGAVFILAFFVILGANKPVDDAEERHLNQKIINDLNNQQWGNQ